ncbi:MAG TPA: NADH-quinone oxidoreductase subunit NuoH [Rhodothermales bacterium]|nr:NADH-quinone oxidoreductase subunit NuoH [Rhodothermales bacterium]HRR07218.1 NADH-quinone oxidoreductase subunit NuoH [Rhodothermales bacterium]
MPLYLIIEKSVLVLFLFAVTMGVAAYSTWAERKIAAFLQDRLGPNRAGVFGLLQPLADGVKMFMKEEFIPSNAEKLLFIAGPGLFMFTALMTGAVIPWGPNLQIADLNIGILYVLGFVSVGVYGIMIGGWASNNKYSLFGAIRASSQMISYELAMGLVVIAIIMLTGSLDLKAIAEQQKGFNWNIIYQPFGFLIYCITALAECNRAPFDLPECETELIGGFHTEYSSMKLGFYLFAEYINMFISAAVIATLYLGGYNMPGLDYSAMNPIVGNAIAFVVLFTKTLLGVFVFIWVRWTLPRFRYDQLMHLGWKILIPLAILNMLLTGAGVLIFG